MNAKNQPTVITVYLSKGGVAKSTIAALLAVYLAEQGHRVALVDLDRQGTQSDIFNLFEADDQPPELLHAALKREIDATAALVPVGGEWPGELFVIPGGALTPLAVDAIKNDPYGYHVGNTSEILRAPLHDLAGVVDYVVMDMGPSDQVLSIGGLNATDWLIMPTDTGRSSVGRIAYVLDEVDTARGLHPVQIAGIVPVKTRHYFGGLRTARSVQIAQEVLNENYGGLLLRDAAGPVELPFHEDWEVIRWVGAYQWMHEDYVNERVKNAARRFLAAVLDKVGVAHG